MQNTRADFPVHQTLHDMIKEEEPKIADNSNTHCTTEMINKLIC